MKKISPSGEGLTGEGLSVEVNDSLLWYQIKVGDALSKQSVDAAAGLSAAVIEARLQTFGENRLAEKPPFSVACIF